MNLLIQYCKKRLKEMKAQSIWDDVVVVCISEFARTLMGNTGNGSDHAWGGKLG